MREKVASIRDSASSQGLSENEYSVLMGFRAVGDSAKQVELAFLVSMGSKALMQSITQSRFEENLNATASLMAECAQCLSTGHNSGKCYRERCRSQMVAGSHQCR